MVFSKVTHLFPNRHIYQINYEHCWGNFELWFKWSLTRCSSTFSGLFLFIELVSKLFSLHSVLCFVSTEIRLSQIKSDFRIFTLDMSSWVRASDSFQILRLLRYFRQLFLCQTYPCDYSNFTQSILPSNIQISSIDSWIWDPFCKLALNEVPGFGLEQILSTGIFQIFKSYRG